MGIYSYLDQLQAAAETAGVDLAKACNKAGVATTTLQRWRNGDVTPRKATADLVLDCIEQLATEQPEQAA